MAESYRGLTIQIGGDTTKLSQALKAANASARETGSQLKKLSDALKLDPSSLKAANLQMGAMASNASATAMRLVSLRDAISQIGSKEFDGKSVRELSENTKNAHMYAEIALASYNKLTDSLGQMNTQVSEFAKNAAEASSKDFGNKMKESFREGAIGAKEITEEVKKLSTAVIAPEDKNLQDFIDKMGNLRTRYEELTEMVSKYERAIAAATEEREKTGNETALARTKKEMAELLATADKAIDRFSNFDAKVFNFENDDTSLKELRQAFETMPDSVRPSQQAIDDFIAEVNTLKVKWDNASSALEKANIVAQYQELTNEIVKTEAQVTSLSRAMANMKLPSDLMRSMYEQTESAKALGDAYTTNMNAAKRMAEAYKLNPDNIEFLVLAEERAAAATLNATENIEQQQAILDKLATERQAIFEFTDATKSAQEQLNEMAFAHEKASEYVARLEGEEGEAVKRIQELAGSVEQVTKALDAASSEDLDADIANNEALVEQIKLLHTVREELVTAHAEEKKFAEGEEMAKKRKEWEEAEVNVANWAARATEARIVGEKLAQTDVTPKYDDDKASRMESAFKKIEEIAASSVGMDKKVEEVKNFDVAVQEAVKRVKTFDDALKANPGNKTFVESRAQAIANATLLAETAQKKLNVAIAQMKSTNIDKVALSTGTVSQKLEEAKNKFTTAVANLRGYENALKKVSTELGNLQRKSESQRTEEDKQRIADLTAEYNRLQQAIKNTVQAGDTAFDEVIVEQNTQSIAQMRDSYDNLTKTIAELGKTAEETHQKNATPKVDEAAFMQVVSRIAQAAKKMGQEIVQSSNEIDSAYRDMRKTVQGVESDFVKLREAAIEYSQNSITSADQMLEMQALGGQLGVATENLEQFGKIASTLDIATDINAEDVALKLGQISNVLGLDIEGMQGFADALVRLGNNMPAQESAIMAVAQRFGAVASTAKFSGDEILAWSAAIAATGQRSEAAATAISNTVSGIEQAVANGGSDLKQFAAIAGMSADEFSAAWKESPTEVLRSFIKGLETLKDSDESAVAALENMGITGVRQQQTLLALTQTIDSLDKALAMSSDAWNQIDDQWGQAGDAAIEAGHKSEGFSGALQILKNNAQNLAASFGDSLVPMMQQAAEILAFVTDTFNNLPGPIKSSIVALGGLTVVFSTLGPMVSVFSKGMAGTIGVIGKFAPAAATAISSMLGIESAATTAAAGTGALATAMTGGVALAVGVAVSALLVGISKINEYYEAQETLRQATEGLESAMSNGRAAYDSYIEGAQESTRTVQELRDAIKEATEAQATYAEKLQSDWEGVSKSEAQVDMLVDKIKELASGSKLSLAEQGELNAAIDTFNNLTGESVHVIDAQTGKLDRSVGVIESMAKAWKGTLENDQLVSQYAEQVKQIADAEELLKEAQDKLSAAESDDWFKSVEDGTLSLSDDIGSLRRDVETYKNTLESLKTVHQQTADSMTPVENTLGDIEALLNQAGYSLTSYGGLTDEQCEQIAKAYEDAGGDATKALEDIVALLDSFRAGGAEASDIARQLEETSKEFYAAQAKAYKADAQNVYNQTKANLDAVYKAKQREYNAEYKALQKSFDAAYKAQQKAFDNEYKALQKQLDRQYDALKKQLDNEYKARKKSYDDQLKALKKSQEDEVDAFNDATDAKLKAMEREYKERVKLLELEYGGKTDSLDEQIDALNAETEAEKAAIEQREEAEKTAELQKAVDQAKSRRKRADAEKALNDYLEEIQQKHNETERNAQIEALKQQQQDLKDELTERKETLKEQYDAEVAAYKDSRAAQLEAIKEANTAEYDTEKERLDGLLETLKESQAARLESVKESQQAQLEALKESQQAQLEAMKDGQQATLESMRESQQIELENLKASHTKQLQDLKASQDAKYKAIKAGEDEQTKAMFEASLKKEQDQKKSNDSMIGEQERHMEKMKEHTNRKLTEMDKMYGSYGEKAPSTLATALEAGTGAVARAAGMVATDVARPFEENAENSFTWGNHMMVGYNNGIVDQWNRGTLLSNIRNIGQSIKNILGFSVPKEGPMSDADKWGPDMVQLIADGIRDEQGTLIRRVEKMSRAVEDAFDPTLTVDAAYEALDTIGRNRKNAMGSIIENHSAAPVTINLNMDLSNVSIRSDEDIEKLAEVMSQKMAAQAARQLAGRLGR